MPPTTVILEPGVTHEGERGRLSDMIRLARDVGADAVKFAWCSNPDRLAERRQAWDYRAAYAYLALPQEWLRELRAECEEAGLAFLCTAYLPEDLPVVLPLVRWAKISSFEAQDRAFLAAHNAYEVPVILSLGAVDIQGAMAAAEPVERLWAVLHTVSAYRAPVEQMNLLAIRDLTAHCPGAVHVGLSDHSAHVLTGAIAAACGASVIEVHARLEDTPAGNPDFPHSLAPEQLRQYVANIRLAERMLGDGIKRVMPCEEPWRRFQVVRP